MPAGDNLIAGRSCVRPATDGYCHAPAADGNPYPNTHTYPAADQHTHRDATAGSTRK